MRFGWIRLHFLLLYASLARTCRTCRCSSAATSACPAVVTQVLHGPVVLGLCLLPPMILNLKAEPRLRDAVGSVLGGYAAEIELRWAFVLGAALALFALVWLATAFNDPDVDVALRMRNPAHS